MCHRTAIEIFQGSNGEETKAFYKCLEGLGRSGILAMNMFRSQKASERAKLYRGGLPGVGRYKDLAYEKKNFSMGLLCSVLENMESKRGASEFRWGWKADPNAEFHKWVLYVDLPQGQVSFHSESRGRGPDYAGDWDGLHKSRERILAFCDTVHSLARAVPA